MCCLGSHQLTYVLNDAAAKQVVKPVEKAAKAVAKDVKQAVKGGTQALTPSKAPALKDAAKDASKAVKSAVKDVPSPKDAPKAIKSAVKDASKIDLNALVRRATALHQMLDMSVLSQALYLMLLSGRMHCTNYCPDWCSQRNESTLQD